MTERRKQGTILGSLYPFIHSLAGESTFELSFLDEESTDLEGWKGVARHELWGRIPEKVQPCPFNDQIVETVDKGDYIREKIHLPPPRNTRVPAYLLIPKNARRAGARPGVLPRSWRHVLLGEGRRSWKWKTSTPSCRRSNRERMAAAHMPRNSAGRDLP